jgi:hypothetical protein
VTQFLDGNARGVLVATSQAVSSEPGGQQICTREYIEALKLAGFELDSVLFESANGFREKLLRRIDRRPYRYFIPDNLADRVSEVARSSKATHIFLNTVNLAPLAPALRERNSNWQIVMLSHGLESVDFVHTLRTMNWRSDFSGLRTAQELLLGRQIVEECRQRLHLDKVMSLAIFEAEIERWLGSRDVLVVPRIVKPHPLQWRPVDGRIGFVGRLDHPPNLEGLLLMLEGLAARDTSRIEVRVAGAPEGHGRELSKRYPFVSYLGVVSDEALLVEAANWTCATNPIFCYARGASTKLAIMAGWGIPLVTTPQGERGYEWSGGGPVVCDTADELVAAVWDIASDPLARARARQQLLGALESPLAPEEIAVRVRTFLLSPS